MNHPIFLLRLVVYENINLRKSLSQVALITEWKKSTHLEVTEHDHSNDLFFRCHDELVIFVLALIISKTKILLYENHNEFATWKKQKK